MSFPEVKLATLLFELSNFNVNVSSIYGNGCGTAYIKFTGTSFEVDGRSYHPDRLILFVGKTPKGVKENSDCYISFNRMWYFISQLKKQDMVIRKKMK